MSIELNEVNRKKKQATILFEIEQCTRFMEVILFDHIGKLIQNLGKCSMYIKY